MNQSTILHLRYNKLQMLSNNLEMEKVPQIRLFGTGENFRRSPSPSYIKQFTFKKSNDSWFSKAQNILKSPSNRSMQRSHSANERESFKPFRTNYYQNALKICQQNRVFDLKKFSSYQYGFLNANYIQYHNHFKQPNGLQTKIGKKIDKNTYQSRHLNIKTTNKQIPLKSQSSSNFTNTNSNQMTIKISPDQQLLKLDLHQNQKDQHFTEKNVIKSHILFQQPSNTGQNSVRQSLTGYLDNFTERQKKQLNFKPIESRGVIEGSNNKPIQSFNQITSHVINRKREQSIPQSPQKSPRSPRSKIFKDNIVNVSRVPQKYQTFQKYKTREQRYVHEMNYKFDNALDDITKTDRSSRRNNYLIDELEEITRENLELKKEFISKLDQILTKYDRPNQTEHIVFNQRQHHQSNGLTRINLASERSQSPGQNTKRRKKLFVTQADSSLINPLLNL